jgi:hypothetical protein
MAAVQPEPWLRALITTTTTTNNNNPPGFDPRTVQPIVIRYTD